MAFLCYGSGSSWFLSDCAPLDRRVPYWKTLAVCAGVWNSANLYWNAALGKPRMLIVTFSPIIHLFKLALSAKVWAKYILDGCTSMHLLLVYYLTLELRWGTYQSLFYLLVTLISLSAALCIKCTILFCVSASGHEWDPVSGMRSCVWYDWHMVPMGCMLWGKFLDGCLQGRLETVRHMLTVVWLQCVFGVHICWNRTQSYSDTNVVT